MADIPERMCDVCCLSDVLICGTVKTKLWVNNHAISDQFLCVNSSNRPPDFDYRWIKSVDCNLKVIFKLSEIVSSEFVGVCCDLLAYKSYRTWLHLAINCCHKTERYTGYAPPSICCFACFKLNCLNRHCVFPRSVSTQNFSTVL